MKVTKKRMWATISSLTDAEKAARFDAIVVWLTKRQRKPRGGLDRAMSAIGTPGHLLGGVGEIVVNGEES